MEPESQTGSGPPPVDQAKKEPITPASTPTATFSIARVLFTLSITCPIMVLLLAGYDYRVRMVPLSHVVILMAPLVGIPAYLFLPRALNANEPRTLWDPLVGSIMLLVFYLTFIMGYVGLSQIRH